MVKVCPDPEAVAQTAAGLFVEQFKKAMGRSDRFSVALSGGHTPLRSYALLAEEPFKSQIDWSRVHVFWGDERCLPVTDLRNNYRAANQAFLSHVPIPPQQIHPILCIDAPRKSAMEYEAVLRRHFGNSSPHFDLVFLGLGKDGHTASLFPGSDRLNEASPWAIEVQNASEDFARISLTAQILNLTRMAVFIAVGQEKSEILKQVLSGAETSPRLPARLIHPIDGDLVWVVDSSCYGELNSTRKIP